MSKPGHTMSVGDIMSTLGDVHYKTSGVYHDECGGIIEGCTLGDTKMHVGVIMSTPGNIQYTRGIP